ncbi:MAG: hydrogenase maturation protease [Deltaproteobacteria bacterium]
MSDLFPTICRAAEPARSPESAAAQVLVVGVGNTLMRDDGIGIEAVEALASGFEIPPSVRIIDGGIAGPAWLAELGAVDHLWIVDAVRRGGTPGGFAWLTLDDLLERRGPILSPHQVGVTEFLGMARILGRLPEDTRILGVEPLATTPCGLGLSDALRLALPDVVCELVGELSRLRVAMPRKRPIPASPT